MVADIAFDIETLKLSNETGDWETFEKEYSPPKNYKDPAKIELHKLAAFEEFKSGDKRKFRIDGCRMISASLGLITPDGVKQLEACSSEDSSHISKFIQTYLKDFKEYRLVGWNIKNFDLPILAVAYWKAKLPRLHSRMKRWSVVDLCDHPFGGKYKLKDAARAFGIEVPDTTGADVEKLHLAGDWGAIEEYNKSDVRITGELFLACSNIWEL